MINYWIVIETILCYKAQALVSDQSSVHWVVPSHRDPCEPPGLTCQTLDEYITEGTLNSSHSKFVFLNGTHHLTKSLMVYDSESLTLQGSEEGNNSVQVVCESRWTIALSFTRVSFLTIQNISFVNCSYNNSFSGPKVIEYVISALHFEGGSNLTLSNVRILNGGFSIINTHGHVEIIRMSVTSWLSETAGSHNLRQSIGGSYFNYFHCCFKLHLIIYESNFQFYNSLLSSRPVSPKHQHKSHGLGLTFNCTNLQITVKKSNFSGFQSAGDGGNMFVSLQKGWYIPTESYMLTLYKCAFQKGHAKQGGGVFISLIQPDLANGTLHNEASKPLRMKISDSTFINNSAQGGGGLGVNWKLQKFLGYPNVVTGYMQLKKCNFTGNFLKMGGLQGGIAVNWITHYAEPFGYHSTFNASFRNCLVRDNYIYKNKACSLGYGVVTIMGSAFHIVDSEFMQNNCTAIKAIGSKLLLDGQVNITNNHGSSGGGLLLCDDSVIVLKPNTQVRIEHNNATHTGGGITVESQCLQTRPMCFFQISDEIFYNSSLLHTVKVVLTNNRAGYAGHNLFGGSIDYCYLTHPLIHEDETLTAIDVFKQTFINLSLANSSVSSIARRVCFCDNGLKNCSKNMTYVRTAPGKTFKVSVVPVGQLLGTLPASVHAKASYDKNTISRNEIIQNIEKGSCQNIVFNVRSKRSHEYIDLSIQHEGDVNGYIRTTLYKTVRIVVKLQPCPIGFDVESMCHYQTHYCVCRCDPKLPKGLSCNVGRQTITKPTWLWIGYITDPIDSNNTLTKYLTAHRCLYDYCSDNKTVDSTSKRLMQDSQCQFHRTGILCGACHRNLSLILGSSACWSCSNNFLALLVVFTFAGLLLVILLTVCNLTISEGKLGGLIFYANIVHISDAAFIPDQWKIFPMVLKTIVAWINLDLGINVCFYNGMDAYAKAWLQFAFPLYLWILSGLIVFLCNRYISVTRLFGTNSVRVLATVILLSFTKLLRAVITTFSCINLDLYVNSTNNITRSLWTSDPNILCLQGKHIPLFALGIVFSIVWTIFIVFLLFIQCWPRLRCCSRIQRLKPFTDSFTGPNTSHGRFWTGLLLLSRLIIAIAYSVYGNSQTPDHYFTAVAVTTICLLLMSACLPLGVYSKHSNNILESFFLANVLLVVFGASNKSNHCTYASVSLSLIIFIGIVVYHCWNRVKRTHYGALLQAKIDRRMAAILKREPVANEGLSNDDPAYPRYCTFDQAIDREPLLAN